MNFRLKKILTRIFDKSIVRKKFYCLMVIISMIYSLAYSLFNLAGLVAKQKIITYMDSDNLPEVFYFFKQNIIFLYSAHRFMFVLCFIGGLFMLYGCYLLIRGYKWGLFFYTTTKGIQIFVPLMFLGFRAFWIGDCMLVILFLVYYYQYCFTHQIDKKARKYNNLVNDQDNN